MKGFVGEFGIEMAIIPWPINVGSRKSELSKGDLERVNTDPSSWTEESSHTFV